MGRKHIRKKPGRRVPSTGPAGLVSSPLDRVGRQALLDSLLVLIVGVLVFANSLGNDFVYDDISMIVENSRLDTLGNLERFFTTSYWGDAIAGDKAYRPLTVWSFAIDRWLFGPGPIGIHVVNVLANGLVGALAYLLIRALTGKRFLASATAILWVIHPVHTEVVANGVGRAEIYAAVSVLAAALLHLRWQRGIQGREFWQGERTTEKRPNVRGIRIFRLCLAGALFLYFVGLFFKESAVVLPGLLLLADWLICCKGRVTPILRRLNVYLLYVVPLGVFLVIRHGVVGAGLPPIQEVMSHATPFGRVLYSSETMLRYIGQTLVPWSLSGEYSDYRNFIRPSLSEPMVVAAILTWIGLSVALVRLYRRGNLVPVFGALWFFLSMLPVSNLLFPIGTIRADRLLYLPSLGILLVVSWAMVRLGRSHSQEAIAVFSIVLLLYAARTVVRNRDWRNPEVFWTKQLELNPGSPIGWGHMGDTFKVLGKTDRAEEAYRKAIALRDVQGLFYPEAHTKVAKIMISRGDSAGAEAEYRLVVEKWPEHYVALLNLGELLLHHRSTVNEAIPLLKRAAAVKARDFRPYANLSQAYRIAGEFDNSLKAIESAIRLRPDIPTLRKVKAEILEGGRRSEVREKL